jgi:hypothetical protein
VRAFLHEVRTFLAEPESKEKLENVRQIMEGGHTGLKANEEDKAA